MNEKYFKTCITIVTIAFAILAFLNFPIFKIANLEVIGLSALREDEVTKALDFNGKTIFSFSTKTANENLKKLSYVSDSTVRKDYPNSLVVTVAERKVRGCVENMSGQYLYIDKDGRVLEVNMQPSEETPVIVGLKFNNFTVGNILNVDNQSAFNNMVELSNLFNQYDMMNIVKLDVSDSNNIHIYIYNIDIIFGSIASAENKMSLTVETLKNIIDVENVKGQLDVTDTKKAVFSLLS